MDGWMEFGYTFPSLRLAISDFTWDIFPVKNTTYQNIDSCVGDLYTSTHTVTTVCAHNEPPYLPNNMI